MSAGGVGLFLPFLGLFFLCKRLLPQSFGQGWFQSASRWRRALSSVFVFPPEVLSWFLFGGLLGTSPHCLQEREELQAR